jgi:hypothetical protein
VTHIQVSHLIKAFWARSFKWGKMLAFSKLKLTNWSFNNPINGPKMKRCGEISKVWNTRCKIHSMYAGSVLYMGRFQNSGRFARSWWFQRYDYCRYLVARGLLRCNTYQKWKQTYKVRKIQTNKLWSFWTDMIFNLPEIPKVMFIENMFSIF